MRGTVLRGDWTRLRRRGDRVWIRFRPYELIWHTTHSFAVADVHSIEIEAVRLQRRRRRRIDVRRGTTRVAEAAITRVTFEYGSGDKASVDLHETEDTVLAAFRDVVDQAALVLEEHPEGMPEAVPDEGTGLPPIRWRADPEPELVIDLRGDQPTLWAGGEALTPELTRDVSFNLDLGAHPRDVRRWVLRQLDEAHAGVPPVATTTDDWLDIEEGPSNSTSGALWVRRRKRRVIPRLRRSASS